MNTYQLEHSSVVLGGVHDEGKCAGEKCPIHNKSNHKMRNMPQHFRADWGGFMERICSHGVGHPDPDCPNAHSVHGCDGCCA